VSNPIIFADKKGGPKGILALTGGKRERKDLHICLKTKGGSALIHWDQRRNLSYTAEVQGKAVGSLAERKRATWSPFPIVPSRLGTAKGKRWGKHHLLVLTQEGGEGDVVATAPHSPGEREKEMKKGGRGRPSPLGLPLILACKRGEKEEPTSPRSFFHGGKKCFHDWKKDKGGKKGKGEKR